MEWVYSFNPEARTGHQSIEGIGEYHHLKWTA